MLHQREVWPRFPITLGSLSIPSSTWELELNDHIMSLKLGFARKRKHHPKGIFYLHLKKNHLKAGYVHEETPDDSIYQGVDTFFKFLARDKSKEEQIHILQYQKEIRVRVKHYRSMELGILERMEKDREDREVQ